MPTDDERGNDGNRTLLSRRSVLRAAGAGMAAGVATQTVGRASAAEGVDLGNQGLSEGDVIDDYLEEYFGNGDRVVIPPGTYQWNGSGLDSPSGGSELVGRGGSGQVVLELSEGATYEDTLDPESGTVLIQGFTVSGTAGGTSSGAGKNGFDLVPGAGAELVLRDLQFPDGAGEGEGRLFYSGGHEGVARVENCYWAGFPSDGAYTEHGSVEFRNCVARNNNLTNIRTGEGENLLENCMLVYDGDLRASETGDTGVRGFNHHETGSVTVRNTDFLWTGDGSAANNPIEIEPEDAAGSDITLENVRIQNGTDVAPVEQGISPDAVTVDGLSVTGDGDTSVSSDQFGDVSGLSTGEDATSPRALSDLFGVLATGLDYTPRDPLGGDGTASDPPSGGGDDEEQRAETSQLVVQSSADAPVFSYRFETTGTVTRITDAGDASAEESDRVEDTEDGSVVRGGLGGGYGDSFQFAGELRSFTTGAASGQITLRLDGEDVTGDYLDTESEEGDEGGDSGSGGDEESGSDDGSEGSDGSDGSDSGNDGDGQSGDGSEDDAGSGDGDASLVEVISVEDGPRFEYAFDATGSVELVEDAGRNSAEAEDAGDGAAVDGVAGNGHGDTFRVTGEIRNFEATVDASEFSVLVDGTDVTDSLLGGGDGSGDESESGDDSGGGDDDETQNDETQNDENQNDENQNDENQNDEQAMLVEVVSVEDGPRFEYAFDATGSVELVEDAGRNSAEAEDAGDGAAVDGVAGNGHGDTFRVTGEIRNFEANTSPEDFYVLADGTDVTSSLVEGADESGETDTGDAPTGDRTCEDGESQQGTTVQIVADRTDDQFRYRFLATGKPVKVRDCALASEDNDSVYMVDEDIYLVEGHAGGDDGDTYRVNGAVESVTATPDDAQFTVYVDGQRQSLDDSLLGQLVALMGGN